MFRLVPDRALFRRQVNVIGFSAAYRDSSAALTRHFLLSSTLQQRASSAR